MAALLTSRLPSRSRFETARGHNRLIIDKYLSSSTRFNATANDAFLTIHNQHIAAINANAMLQFEEALDLLRDLYDNYVMQTAIPTTSATVSHESYRAYLTRQLTSVLGKAQEISALELGRRATEMASYLTSPSALSDLNEALVRNLSSALLLGDEQLSAELADKIVDNAEREQGIRRIISLKALGAWSLRRGSLVEAEEFLSTSASLAQQQDFYHQLAKVRQLLKVLERRPDQLTFAAGAKGARAIKLII